MRPPKSLDNRDHNNDHNKGARQTASQKFISYAFGKIVALWPADTRDWALAMQAELPQMESTQESLQWLAGGFMSLIKAWWSGSISSDNKVELAPVKKPGILAALVAVAALALLLIPSANQGLRAVLTSWQPNHFRVYQAQLLRIAHDAESRGDAKTMAFAAMRFESRKDFISLANKAVALDPSLTWIYSQGYQSDSWAPEARDWAAKLEAWDPGNAVGYLVQAELRRSELIHDGQYAWDVPIHDPQWIESGRKAMESPRYDSYRVQRIQLDQEIIRAQGLNSLEAIWFGAFPSRWISGWPAQTYSNSVIKDAKEALERGDKVTARREAWAVAHYGELLHAHGGNDGERLSSVGYLRPAYTILQPLLAAEGRSDEARMMSQELEAIRPGAPGAVYGYSFYSSGGWWRPASLAINLAVALAVPLSIALLFAIAWLFAARFSPQLSSGLLYRMACRCARFAPAGVLISLVVLAISYSPAAESVSDYLNRPISIGTMRNITEAYASIYYAQDFMRTATGGKYHPMFWMSVTILGFLAIATIIGRNILNRAMRPKVA
jgi:hypothetical protein